MNGGLLSSYSNRPRIRRDFQEEMPAACIAHQLCLSLEHKICMLRHCARSLGLKVEPGSPINKMLDN